MDKIDHGSHIEALRGCSRSRAVLMYQFLTKAEEYGLDMEAFGREVFNECGCIRARTSFPETDSVKEFAAVYQTEDWVKTFDTVVRECTDDKLVVNSYYCPLLEAWRELTDDKERIALICDMAMDGDRALAARYPSFCFDVPKSLAKGDPYCEVVVTRKKEKQ